MKNFFFIVGTIWCGNKGCKRSGKYHGESSQYPGFIETQTPQDIIKAIDEEIGWLLTEEGDALCPEHKKFHNTTTSSESAVSSA